MIIILYILFTHCSDDFPNKEICKENDKTCTKSDEQLKSDCSSHSKIFKQNKSTLKSIDYSYDEIINGNPLQYEERIYLEMLDYINNNTVSVIEAFEKYYLSDDKEYLSEENIENQKTFNLGIENNESLNHCETKLTYINDNHENIDNLEREFECSATSNNQSSQNKFPINMKEENGKNLKNEKPNENSISRKKFKKEKQKQKQKSKNNTDPRKEFETLFSRINNYGIYQKKIFISVINKICDSKFRPHFLNLEIRIRADCTNFRCFKEVVSFSCATLVGKKQNNYENLHTNLCAKLNEEFDSFIIYISKFMERFGHLVKFTKHQTYLFSQVKKKETIYNGDTQELKKIFKNKFLYKLIPEIDLICINIMSLKINLNTTAIMSFILRLLIIKSEFMLEQENTNLEILLDDLLYFRSFLSFIYLFRKGDLKIQQDSILLLFLNYINVHDPVFGKLFINFLFKEKNNFVDKRSHWPREVVYFIGFTDLKSLSSLKESILKKIDYEEILKYECEVFDETLFLEQLKIMRSSSN